MPVIPAESRLLTEFAQCATVASGVDTFDRRTRAYCVVCDRDMPAACAPAMSCHGESPTKTASSGADPQVGKSRAEQRRVRLAIAHLR